MSSMKPKDVIVIGCGPAGATAATLLAERGIDVLVLERDTFPRFKIGESLMPGTFRTLARLGVLELLKKSAFPKKYSVQFYSKSGKAGVPFFFQENGSGEEAQTWQVLRSDFDNLMLENAVARGARVMQGVAITDIQFDGVRVTGVRARMPDKSSQEFQCKVLVDASGQSALLARKLKMLRTEKDLSNAAVFSHFEGVLREEGTAEGGTIIYHTENADSWFWFIPLPNDVVSIGVVGHIDYLLKSRTKEAQTIFDEELLKCRALLPRLEHAGQLFPMKTTKEFSYKADQMAGDGWVLIGDAFGFLDPIYSSGIFLALKSGEMAADTIYDALQKSDLSGRQLGSFAAHYLSGVESIRKLVYAFYNKEFSFARFLKKYPDSRRDIINILVGNVYDDPPNGLFQRFAEFGVR